LIFFSCFSFFFFFFDDVKIERRTKSALFVFLLLLLSKMTKRRGSKVVRGKERKQTLKSAIELIKTGVSVYHASRRFRIPEETLRYHRRKTLDINNFTGGRKSALGSKREEQLGAWVNEMVDRGFAVDRNLINKKARLIDPNLRCSWRWFYVCLLSSLPSLPPFLPSSLPSFLPSFLLFWKENNRIKKSQRG